MNTLLLRDAAIFSLNHDYGRKINKSANWKQKQQQKES